MKVNDKERLQKIRRKEMIDYLKEHRELPGYSDHWTPGRGDYKTKLLAKAKIGSSSYETKCARKWRKCKEKLETKRIRHQKIEEDERR